MGLSKETEFIIDKDITKHIPSHDGSGYIYELFVRRNNTKLEYNTKLNLRNTGLVNIKLKENDIEQKVELPFLMLWAFANFLKEAPNSGSADCRTFASQMVGKPLPIEPSFNPFEAKSFDAKPFQDESSIRVGAVVATVGHRLFNHYSLKLTDDVYIFRGGMGGPLVSANLEETLKLYPGRQIYIIQPKHKQFHP